MTPQQKKKKLEFAYAHLAEARNNLGGISPTHGKEENNRYLLEAYERVEIAMRYMRSALSKPR